MTIDLAEVHPADRPHVRRLGRALRRDESASCDHGLHVNACRTCIELRHAEAGSITVRAAYAFGDWPPPVAR